MLEKMYHEISDYEDKGKGQRPIIVDFQNSKLASGQEKKVKTKLFRKSNNNHSVLVASAGNILYTGKVRNSKNELYNRYLLVHNRNSGKVRIVAVDSTLLKAKFLEKDDVDLPVETPSSYASATAKLNKQFGSKKIKRITEQRERLNFNVESVKDQLEETVAHVELDETLPIKTDNLENESLYRPPIHRDASSRENVYILSEIVPMRVLDSLEEEAAQALENADSSELNDMLKEQVQILNDMQDPNLLVKCKLIVYLNYLMKYVTIAAKNLTVKYTLCHSSPVANNYIFETYATTVGNKRTRPIAMRDKTLCSILVLAMISFDYELNIEVLSKHVKVGFKKLQEMSRILAFSSTKSKQIMSLKIPLPAAIAVSAKKRKQ